MSIREVRCATCHETRPVNAFGRCCVCGHVIADASVESPSRLLWHLRQHGPLYASVTFFGLAAAGIALPASLGVDPSVAKWPIKVVLVAGGSLFVVWVKGRFA